MPAYFDAHCGISLNKTHALLLALKSVSNDNLYDVCLSAWLYNFETETLTDLSWCINPFRKFLTVRIACTHQFAKFADM